MFSKSDIKSIWHSIVLSWRLGFVRIPILLKGDVTSKYMINLGHKLEEFHSRGMKIAQHVEGKCRIYITKNQVKI